MSKTEAQTIPLIAPGAEPMILETLKQGADRHERAIVRLEALIDRLDEHWSLSDLDASDVELVTEALNLALAKREDDLASVSGGIKELEKALG